MARVATTVRKARQGSVYGEGRGSRDKTTGSPDLRGGVRDVQRAVGTGTMSVGSRKGSHRQVRNQRASSQRSVGPEVDSIVQRAYEDLRVIPRGGNERKLCWALVEAGFFKPPVDRMQDVFELEGLAPRELKQRVVNGLLVSEPKHLTQKEQEEKKKFEEALAGGKIGAEYQSPSGNMPAETPHPHASEGVKVDVDPMNPPKPTSADAKKFAELSELAQIQQLIVDECDAIKTMLLSKNTAYGSSFSNPLRVFAKGMSIESHILVRIDDKLSRLARGSAAGEDVVSDLIGYLTLLRVVRKMNP